jgi:hypothetical protein
VIGWHGERLLAEEEIVAARVVLWLSAAIWLPYGLYCLAQPGSLEAAAGVAFTSATGSTELRAMYGGLQIAIGLLALGGALRPSLERTALVTLALLCAGLGSARLLGSALDGGLSSYTATGLGFELTTAALCGWLLSRGAGSAASAR